MRLGPPGLPPALREAILKREAVAKPRVEERAAFADAMAMLGAFFGAGIGITPLFSSRDSGMAFHGLLLLAACGVAIFHVLEHSFDSKPVIATGYMDGPIKLATIVLG
jgi:hypothetical protein